MCIITPLTLLYETAMQDIIPFINNHLMLVSATAFVLLLLLFMEFIKLKQSASRLTPAQAIRAINHQKAVIIDIRSPDAFSTGHITDSVSLPLPDLNNKIKKIEKFKSQPIVLVCATGVDSSKAAASLAQHGFHAHILNGGIRAWRDADMPLVKG